MTRYILILLLMHFNLFWVIVSVTTAIDLTVIGHLRGWKSIRYPKWLNGFIDKKHLGAELLKDCGTHPKVLWMLLVDFLVLLGLIGTTITIFQVVNDIPLWNLWLIDALFYAFLLSRLIFFKVFTRRFYRSHSLVDKTSQ
mgnify:FL=1